MKRLHLLWMSLLTGLLALHFVGQQRHDSELAELQNDLAARSSSATTQRIDAGARRAALRLPFAPASAPPAQQHATEALALAGEAVQRPPVVEVAEVRDHLEVSFAGQRVDTRWSDEARRTAEIRLSAVLSKTSRLQSLECRASMCRIETEHQGLESYQQFVQSAFLTPETKLWNGAFFTTQLADPVDGKFVIVSYLAREGEQLPRPDEHL